MNNGCVQNRKHLIFLLLICALKLLAEEKKDFSQKYIFITENILIFIIIFILEICILENKYFLTRVSDKKKIPTIFKS